MNVFTLTDGKWIDYCESSSLSIPHTGPMPLIVPLMICGILTLFLVTILARSFKTRRRFVTPDDFEEAYERIITRMPLMETCSGTDLHLLCRATSRDLLQITSFVNNDIARWVNRYHSRGHRDSRRIAPMVLLLRENQLLRYGAIQIQILYHIKPLRASMVRRTNETMMVFSTSWLALMKRYCLENLAYVDQLWKAQEQTVQAGQGHLNR